MYEIYYLLGVIFMEKQYKDIIVVGFALFAMFFGAGNLIFPLYLGLVSGNQWLIGFLGFVIADVGLALLAILASAKCGGDISRLSNYGSTRGNSFVSSSNNITWPKRLY